VSEGEAMKKFFIFILVSLMGAAVWAAKPNSFGGDDDLFPWPWGTECPFPWQDIKGTYLVRSAKPAPHSGHFLKVSVDQKNDSIEFLNITEYDENGQLYAKGKGYAQQNERIVKGLLYQAASGTSFTVMVRSYAENKSPQCLGDLVTAVTFCPLRGKKCTSETSYLLQPVDQN